MEDNYYKEHYKCIQDSIVNDIVSFKPLGWDIHIVVKFSLKPYWEVDGVYFSLVPDHSRGDCFSNYFCRDSKTEMYGSFLADTGIEAYKKAVNIIMDELERYGKEYPVYLTALKNIKLVPEEEVQKIVEENHKLRI